MIGLRGAATTPAHYYSSMRDGERFYDVDGLELADREAARAEAIGLACDLVRLAHDRRDRSGWAIRATYEGHDLALRRSRKPPAGAEQTLLLRRDDGPGEPGRSCRPRPAAAAGSICAAANLTAPAARPT